MRSDWGAYGLPVVTPSLDALAKKSLLFEHAYCQLSVCAPSRMSFMTSKRPDTNRVWNFIDTNPLTTQATPGHFRDHGYITLGLGKTFHQAAGAWNANQYWSLDEQPYFPYESGRCPHGGEGGGHCIQEDSQIYDWHLRLKTIEYLKYAANKSKASGRPFYVMAGFRKPHAPWQAPQRMWDLYNSSTIALPTHKTIPTGAPLIAWSNQLEVALENGTSFRYDPHNAVPDWVIQDQRHAYYACVSYVDEHVGAILQTLDESGAADDTAVIFHADHGYHLGEHGEWEKKSNWDLVVRVSNCSSSVAVLLPLHSLTTASVAGTTHDSCAVAPEFFRSAYKRAGRINRRDANSCRHSRPPSPCGCGWRRHLAASAGISRQCLGWVGAWASEGASGSVPPVPSLWVQ
jgi:arylsulfatase A-like enzyme